MRTRSGSKKCLLGTSNVKKEKLDEPRAQPSNKKTTNAAATRPDEEVTRSVQNKETAHHQRKCTRTGRSTVGEKNSKKEDQKNIRAICKKTMTKKELEERVLEVEKLLSEAQARNRELASEYDDYRKRVCTSVLELVDDDAWMMADGVRIDDYGANKGMEHKSSGSSVTESSFCTMCNYCSRK